MRRAGRLSITLGTIVTSAVALAACGSGQRQDVNEPNAKFPVSVTTASFPAHQRLSEHTELTLVIRNTGKHAIPNLAVTICNVTCSYRAPVGEGTSVAPFADYLRMQGLASHSRPVWVIDTPPGPCTYSCRNGGEGSYFTSSSNTWASGELKPGATARFKWGVTAVAAGAHTVAWEVSAGLYGKAKAITASKKTPQGTFKVLISQQPAKSFVTGSGQVVNSQ